MGELQKSWLFSSSSSSLFLIILASGSKRVVFLNPGDLIQISFLSGDF